MKRQLKRVKTRLENIGRAAERAASEAVVRAADETAQAARELAPVDSGELRGSICTHRLSPLEACVTAGAAHAAAVEFGTSRSAAQPYLLPAVQMQRAPLSQYAQKVFARRKGGKA